ncbi:MAG TPA: hypothetical protein VMY34_04125 [Acidimicrobiales bacterium]|nr:hypothetical protein [Acidimicrobiales bacterium]
MGQSVAVVEKQSGRPGVLRFELNRSLSGMAHERYLSGGEILGERPPDVLARRLLETGKVVAVHVYSNQVTVELKPFENGDGLLDVVRGLFTHYTEGVEPKTFPPA